MIWRISPTAVCLIVILWSMCEWVSECSNNNIIVILLQSTHGTFCTFCGMYMLVSLHHSVGSIHNKPSLHADIIIMRDCRWKASINEDVVSTSYVFVFLNSIGRMTVSTFLATTVKLKDLGFFKLLLQIRLYKITLNQITLEGLYCSHRGFWFATVVNAVSTHHPKDI